MSAHAEKNPSHDKPPGMAAGTTAIAQLADEITYRGYPLAELAESCSFEEVAYLLLRGDLPGPKEKARFIHRLNASRHLPEALGDLLSSLPAWTPPIDALRTSVSVLAHFDQDATDSSPEAKLRMAERLLAQIPAAIALRARAVQGLQPVEPKEGLGHAAQFLYQLRGKDPALEEPRAMEMALIVFAEHEFNPSTYTSRVVASTGSDLHSSVVAAICALKGQRHGGADEEVVRLVERLAPAGTEGKPLAGHVLPQGPIAGFGHPMYPQGDPRSALLEPHVAPMLEAAGLAEWNIVSRQVRDLLNIERGLHPSIEWSTGRLFHALGLDVSLFAPAMVLARVVGWSAHHLEQFEDPRTIRPRAIYSGPVKRGVRPIESREDI
ncbi:MAG: citrate/2-methylcitrate synthase [Gemmataceae bacterium]